MKIAAPQLLSHRAQRQLLILCVVLVIAWIVGLTNAAIQSPSGENPFVTAYHALLR